MFPQPAPSALTVQPRSERPQDPPAPGSREPGADPASGPEAFRSADTHLNIIPVDPHRLFVHWWVAPETLEQARQDLAAPAVATLTLRILRLDEPANGDAPPAEEDFTLGAGWHEQFLSLRAPGGRVAGALGIKDGAGRFTAMLTTLPVALPQAPAANGHTRPAEVPVRSAEPPPPSVAPSLPPPVLDEDAILARAARLEGLPPELRRLPGNAAGAAEVAEVASPDAVRDELPAPPPDTPTVNERRVVLAAFAADLAAKPVPRENPVAVPAAPSPAPAATSSRLASQIGAMPAEAPVQLQAVLVISGRVRPGHRLRLGAGEVAVRPDGSFTCQQRVDYFPAAWSLLLQAAAQPETAVTPSLELLARMPDAGALLTLDSCVEIEGQVSDPGYRAFLPPGVNPDAAGRFRLVRTLPPGALFLPHLVLVGAEDTGA